MKDENNFPIHSQFWIYLTRQKHIRDAHDYNVNRAWKLW